MTDCSICHRHLSATCDSNVRPIVQLQAPRPFLSVSGSGHNCCLRDYLFSYTDAFLNSIQSLKPLVSQSEFTYTFSNCGLCHMSYYVFACITNKRYKGLFQAQATSVYCQQTGSVLNKDIKNCVSLLDPSFTMNEMHSIYPLLVRINRCRGSSAEAKRGERSKQITHIVLVPRLRTDGDIPPLPLHAFMAREWTISPFYLLMMLDVSLLDSCTANQEPTLYRVLKSGTPSKTGSKLAELSPVNSKRVQRR